MDSLVLTEDHALRLLSAIRKYGRPAVVDWTNHHITILSEKKVDPKVQLSTGPMEYWDKLFQISHDGRIIEKPPTPDLKGRPSSSGQWKIGDQVWIDQPKIVDPWQGEILFFNKKGNRAVVRSHDPGDIAYTSDIYNQGHWAWAQITVKKGEQMVFEVDVAWLRTEKPEKPGGTNA